MSELKRVNEELSKQQKEKVVADRPPEDRRVKLTPEESAKIKDDFEQMKLEAAQKSMEWEEEARAAVEAVPDKPPVTGRQEMPIVRIPPEPITAPRTHGETPPPNRAQEAQVRTQILKPVETEKSGVFEKLKGLFRKK